MARRGTHNRGEPPPDPPRWYRVEEVTVIRGPRPRRLRRLVSKLRRTGVVRVTVVAVAAAAVVAGVTASLALEGKGVGDATAQARAPGPPAVAAAYQYPLSCLLVTLAASDRDYARARLDPASPCWRHGIYQATIFPRADGVWRLVLDAAHSYSCPVRSLPAIVQIGLGVCPLSGQPAASPAGRPRWGATIYEP